MSNKKKFNNKALRAEINKELIFFRNIFSVVSIPIQTKGNEDENADYEMVASNQEGTEVKSKRAVSITELEDKLEKLKSQSNNKFNLKNKLLKKSLNSKLSKKLKKKERLEKNKPSKVIQNGTKTDNHNSTSLEHEPNVKAAKPIFNQDGKLVFSKFDFANVGKHKDKHNKLEKDPKRMLDNLKKQEETFKSLEEKGQKDKVMELKEKAAWKTILQKAEGQKVKDDPMLLKKSIKKLEQKMKKTKKDWQNRVKTVEQKKEDRQQKRKENISKKKKEKKSKVIKAAVKRGRVVI